ncbi:MAG: pilus assembly protein PilX [Proteobacteria bacterium]|nr:MAG: pilus assembly protein PilX [Pseudomonadota bacterium]
MNQQRIQAQYGQRGAALIVSLIVLLVLTMLGLTAIQNSSLQARMATSMVDRSIAFEAAEAALRDAQNWLDAQVVKPVGGTSGRPDVWASGDAIVMAVGKDAEAWTSADWAGHARSYSKTLSGAVELPRYVIEELQFVPDSLEVGTTTGIWYYRVTARGLGGTGNAEALLQASLRKRFN